MIFIRCRLKIVIYLDNSCYKEGWKAYSQNCKRSYNYNSRVSILSFLIIKKLGELTKQNLAVI